MCGHGSSQVIQVVGGSGSHQACLYLHPLQLNCWSGGLSIFLIPQLNPQNRNVVRIVSSGETSWARQREGNWEERSRAQKPMPFSRLVSAFATQLPAKDL